MSSYTAFKALAPVHPPSGSLCSQEEDSYIHGPGYMGLRVALSVCAAHQARSTTKA